MCPQLEQCDVATPVVLAVIYTAVMTFFLAYVFWKYVLEIIRAKEIKHLRVIILDLLVQFGVFLSTIGG